MSPKGRKTTTETCLAAVAKEYDKARKPEGRAGPNCVHYDALPPGFSNFIRHEDIPTVQDANAQPLATIGVIALYTQVGTTIVATDFV
eukprot:IDg3655t1